jgi:hypothetical protein
VGFSVGLPWGFSVGRRFLFAYIKMTTAPWHLHDPTRINGVSTALLATPVTHSDSECTIEHAVDPTTVGPQRLSLVQVDYELFQWAFDADAWALRYIVSNSMRLFKRPLSTVEAKAMYCPIVDWKYPRDHCIRASVDVRTVELWDCHTGNVTASSEWVDRDVTPVFELRSLWIADTGDRCGLTLDITDMVWDSSEE